MVCTTNRIPKSTKNHLSNKSKLIDKHSGEYKKEIFNHSFNYLSNDAPTLKNKEEFIKNINKAENEFSNKALSVDRGLGRKAMKIITNFILHVTGLFVLANTLNLAITGNWLFYNKTRSEKMIEATSKNIDHILSDEKVNKTIKGGSDEKPTIAYKKSLLEHQKKDTNKQNETTEQVPFNDILYYPRS